MLVKFEQNRIGPNYTMSFLTKSRVFLNHFRQSVDAILYDVSVTETII